MFNNLEIKRYGYLVNYKECFLVGIRCSITKNMFVEVNRLRDYLGKKCV